MKKATLTIIIAAVIGGGIWFSFGSNKDKDNVARSMINFEETGHLVKDNPGLKLGVWYLIYEAPGAPALTVELFFDDNSYCVYNGVQGECPDVLLPSSTLTEIKGYEENDVVRVVSAVSGND